MNDDLISRKAAIEAIESIGSLDTNADREYARSVFETLPSVQPEIESKTGQWKKTLKSYEDEEQAFDYYEITCSECGGEPENEYHLTRFCPSCGAKMKGEAE